VFTECPFVQVLSVGWSKDAKFIVMGGEDDLVTVFSLSERQVSDNPSPKTTTPALKLQPLSPEMTTLALKLQPEP
jgi:hypothetical protein